MIVTIADKHEVAKETLMVTFEVKEDFTFQPGQYIDILLHNPPYNDAKGPKRHFSIVNSPNQKGILAFTTRLRDSAFKKSIQEMPIGTKVEITHIGGSFTLPEDTGKSYVFIAGGIGITPFMSMLRYIQEGNLPYTITLIYSNRDKPSSAFLEELENMAKANPNLKLIVTMTEDPNWTGEKRRIDANFIKEYLKEPNSYTFMVAGPPPMVEAIFTALKEAGANENNIITENFTGY